MAESTHQETIRKKRVFLVASIDLQKTLILDQLVQDDVLSMQQLASIKEKCATNIQTTSALLDHLYRGSRENWDIFIKSLSSYGHKYVVDYLKASANGYHRKKYPKDPRPDGQPVSGESAGGLTRPPRVMELQWKLAGIIKQLYDKIPLWTLHSDHCRIPMDNLYVDLVLVKENQRPLGKEEHLQGYRDIFKQSGNRSTIYIYGEPGVGKSTFIQHLCVEWAKLHDKGAQLENSVDDIFENYQFVLPLFLRDIKPGDRICEVFTEAYQLRRTEAEELYRHIVKTERPIMIIADGLDEYNDTTSEDITKLLLREVFPHITLLVTSRFSLESYFADDKLRPDIEVALRGFSEAGIQEYLFKFFDQSEEKSVALLKEIKKSEELIHLSHYPAILLMMATLGESSKLPSTVTGFYEEFVAYVFARMEKKEKRVAERAKSTKEILEKYKPQVMTLGRLARGNLGTHKLELIFKRSDVDKHVSSADLNTGFLIERKTLFREIFYTFTHKTVQEYFLAFYLINSDETTQKELLFRFFNSRKAFAESGMIRRFLAGLGGEKIHKLIELYIETDELDRGWMHTDLHLEYLAEHQDTRITLPSLVWLAINNRYPASHYVKFLNQDGRELKSMIVETRDMSHFRLLQHLVAPQLSHLELLWWYISGPPCSVHADFIKGTLDETLGNFKQLKFLRVHHLRDFSESSAVVRAVADIRTLQYLDLRRALLTDECIQRLIQCLPGSQLNTLMMTTCDLKTRYVLALIDAAPETLTDLDLSDTCRIKEDCDPVTVIEMTEQLKKLTKLKLQSLNISNCRLSPPGVLAVIDSFPETLTHLDVSWNCWEMTGDLMKVTERTTQLRKLNKLNLKKNHISHDVVLTVKQKLTETCPHLHLLIDCQGYTYSQSLWRGIDDGESVETDSDNVISLEENTNNALQ